MSPSRGVSGRCSASAVLSHSHLSNRRFFMRGRPGVQRTGLSMKREGMIS